MLVNARLALLTCTPCVLISPPPLLCWAVIIYICSNSINFPPLSPYKPTRLNCWFSIALKLLPEHLSSISCVLLRFESSWCVREWANEWMHVCVRECVRVPLDSQTKFNTVLLARARALYLFTPKMAEVEPWSKLENVYSCRIISFAIVNGRVTNQPTTNTTISYQAVNGT